MKIKSTTSIGSVELELIQFDLFIACSGYEKRASFITTDLKIKANKKVCLSFRRLDDVLNRKDNDTLFMKSGFLILQSNIDSHIEIREVLESFITNYKSGTINILVDYSSMSRVWYSYILSFFDKLELDLIVNVYFSYSQSYFSPPPEIEAYKSFISPIEGYYSILPPTKPTALIISLGYIKRQAFGLSEYFDAEPYVFIAQNNEDDLFYKAVIDNNKLLLSNVQENNIFKFSLSNLKYTESLLISLCKDLSSRYRIVIAPCGPKPFTLISFIACLKLNEIDVWRISASSNDAPVDSIPTGEVITLKVEFSSKKFID